MRTFIIVIFSLLLLTSCKKSEDTIMLEETGSWTFKTKDGEVQSVRWKQFSDDSISIKIPRNWTPSESNLFWKHFRYDNEDSQLHFSIQKYDEQKIRVNVDRYMVEGFKQISNKIDSFRYTLRKLHLTGGGYCYLMTMFTKEKGIEYTTYSFVFQPKSLIFDFVLKTRTDISSEEINYRTFLSVVQDFSYGGAPIFEDSELKVSGEQRIKIQDVVSSIKHSNPR